MVCRKQLVCLEVNGAVRHASRGRARALFGRLPVGPGKREVVHSLRHDGCRCVPAYIPVPVRRIGANDEKIRACFKGTMTRAGDGTHSESPAERATFNVRHHELQSGIG
jgi:hypothetical protein